MTSNKKERNKEKSEIKLTKKRNRSNSQKKK